MSDRLGSNLNNTSDGQTAGSWQSPQTPGGWHAPSTATEDNAGWHTPDSKTDTETTGAWRVPALPKDLDEAPEGTELWHLPQPRDTTFTPEDEVELTKPADEGLDEDTADALLVEDEASPEEIETLEETPDDEVDTEEALPFDELTVTDSLPAVEEDTADAEAPDDESLPVLAYEDDDDEDSFSMSELIALASLVDADDAVEAAVEQEEAPAGAAEVADPNDPAEYARQQLARLASNVETPAEEEPAQEPAVEQSQPEPAPAVQDPAQAALAEKYRTTEARVRELRAQYRAGTLSREDFQNQLRQLMVMDEDQVWWMMGVETDTWYRYDDGEWIAATPPALQGAAPTDSTAGENGAGQNTVQSPALDENRTIPTAAVGADDEYMALPRAVPVRDPDFTLPGNAGVYLPPVPSDFGATQPTAAISDATVASAPISGATVSSAPVQGNYGAATGVSVPGPMTAPDQTEPPDYDLNRPSPIYEEAMKRRRQTSTRSVVIAGVVLLAVLFVLAACGITAGLAYYASLAGPWQDEIDALANYVPQFQTARILDAEGNVIVELTSRDGGARTRVPLREISPYMIHALISTENERFYDDPGWDPIAIGRAFLQNLTAGDIESGASTITQQVARNLIMQDTTVSAERKLQEIVIASEIARRPEFDKNFILELYLNEFFFGNQSYGVEAASQFYFGHSAADLNLAESAMLAGLIQAPATYDPLINRDAAFDRMDAVLRLMRDVGCIEFQHAPYQGEPFCITDEQVRLDQNGDIVGGQVLIERALVETTNFEPREYTLRYPHFVNFVQAQVEQEFGTAEMFRRGFTIRTTLIPRIQDTAQDALSRQISAVGGSGINTGAVMVTDPQTGAIRAMVGSPDFSNEDISGQVNNTLTWQQPGSSIKPIVYVAALEGVETDTGFRYMTPATVIWDVPTTYNTQPPYSPVNFDRQFHGPVALRYALQNSYNVPAVKAFEFIGVDKFRDVATRMGLRFQEGSQFGLPSALGANEIRMYDHMQAYAAIANGGQRVPLFAITGITDADGNEVELPERPQPVPAIQPQIAFLMANILSDNEARADAFGLNSGLIIPGYEGRLAAKTGTANDNTDLWTMGFTTNAVVGVWAGRANDNNPTAGSTSAVTIPVWNEVMRAALQGTNPEPFPNPGGIVTRQICADTGTEFDPNQTCQNVRNELFLQNQLPPPASQAFVQTIPVDTWTGLRANQYCNESVETRTFVSIDDPAAVQWLASSQGQAVAQQLGLPEQVEAAPQQECSPSTQLPNIRINQPVEGEQLVGVVQVVGSVVAPDFNRYQLEIAPITSPENFQIVDGPYGAQQQPGSIIGRWDTTQVPNGIYRLRLAAFSNQGGYVYRTVQVGVNNQQPTPTTPPLPTAAPTQPVLQPTLGVDTGTTGNPGVAPTTDGIFDTLPFDIQVSTAVPPATVEVPGL